MAFDQAGNLYGTTFNDGGRIYQLAPSNGNWTFSTLHYFGAYDGFFDGPTLDAAGNVYGAVYFPSTVSKLTRSNGWLETDLYNFLTTPMVSCLSVAWSWTQMEMSTAQHPSAGSMAVRVSMAAALCSRSRRKAGVSGQWSVVGERFLVTNSARSRKRA